MDFQKRVEAYAAKIRAGTLTLAKVPARYRAAVKALLEAGVMTEP